MPRVLDKTKAFNNNNNNNAEDDRAMITLMFSSNAAKTFILYILVPISCKHKYFYTNLLLFLDKISKLKALVDDISNNSNFKSL